MSVLDKAKAHFREVLAQGLKGPIRVPEWDTEIYYKPAVSFYAESKVIELQQQGKTTEALVEMLIVRACTIDGTAMFNRADKTEIMRSVDPSIVLRIITEMNDVEAEQLTETALKN